MLLILLSHFVMAQTPLFEADCGDLQDLPNGAPPMSAPYTGIRIRFENGHFRLIVEERDSSAKRTVPLIWDASYQQHVARFSNGEAWRVTRDSVGGLAVQISNKYTRCASTAVARDPFDGQAFDVDRVWKAVRDVAGGCGTGLE